MQEWTVGGGLPPGEALDRAVGAMASLADRWDESAAEAILAPAVDRGALRAQLAALGTLYGPCRRGAPAGGDGTTQATVTLDCERGAVDLSVTAEPSTGRITAAGFSRPDGAHCVP